MRVNILKIILNCGIDVILVDETSYLMVVSIIDVHKQKAAHALRSKPLKRVLMPQYPNNG